MSLLEAIVTMVGLIGVYFVPGFIWSYVFFPETTSTDRGPSRQLRTVGIIERLVLSFALSFALVPLLLFIANQISGIPVNGTLVGLTTLLVAVLGLIAIYLISRNVYSRLYTNLRSTWGRFLKF